jgi:hypothetical protein
MAGCVYLDNRKARIVPDQPRIGLSRRSARFCRGKVRPYQCLRLFPDSGIAFDLGVLLPEDAVVPGIIDAVVRTRLIVKFEISDDARACRIGGSNFGLAPQRSVRLIEICRLGHVCGDDRVILTNFRDTIHLNREEHRDIVFTQLACQGDGFRATQL